MKPLTSPPPPDVIVQREWSARAAMGRPGLEHPVLQHSFLRAGLFAWAGLGLAGAVTLGLSVLLLVRVVVVPLALALFPAAVLTPAVRWLTARRIRRTLAALGVLLAWIGLTGAAVALLIPQVSGQLDSLKISLVSGMQHVERLLASEPFGLPPLQLNQIVAEVRARATSDGSLLAGSLGAAHVATDVLVGSLLALIALFFYLRDGRVLFTWLLKPWPQRLRGHVQRIGEQVWVTIGSYVRAQLALAATNAVLVAVGLVVLDVPLVLPLAALVFAGGLFPFVGVLIAGGAAVLVALAEVGPATAGLLLALIVVLHQLELHVLAPVVQSRVLGLHPLAIVVSLVTGAALFGVLGAFVAVPITASVAKAATCLRTSGEGHGRDEETKPTPGGRSAPGVTEEFRDA